MYSKIGSFRRYLGALCVPVVDTPHGKSVVTHEWAGASANMGAGLAVTMNRMYVKNYRVDIAKEKLAEQALANNCKFALFLDDDVIPPGDALLKMVELWRSDPKYKVISGVYWSKSVPSVPLIFKGEMEGSYWDWKVTDLIEADAAGAGLLFVDTDIFRRMSRPWFSCDYYFDDPRSDIDVKHWALIDQLGAEVGKGKDADEKVIKELQKAIAETKKEIDEAQDPSKIDPKYFQNKRSDGGTTEDLYFFKKLKDELGEKLWIDCSIQAEHQDKGTGMTYGIRPGMPQLDPRYKGRMEPDDKIVLDIGAGSSTYQFMEGPAIRIDNNPEFHPDILCDARQLAVDDLYADMIHASYILEYFSFKETVSVLKEWIRTLKIGGKLVLVIPNLKLAAKHVYEGVADQQRGDFAMYHIYGEQVGSKRQANEYYHKAGFTKDSVIGLLSRLDTLVDVEVVTTDGGYHNYDQEGLIHTEDDLGTNIVAIATKIKHDAPISLKIPMGVQEEKFRQMKSVDKPKQKTVKKEKPQIHKVTKKQAKE